MNSQSQEWSLRIEAVNLDHSVYDTHDISTIRGGSFMLLEVVNKLHEKIPALQPEVTGASVGLFLFSCRDENEKEKILGDVETELEKQTGQFATFVYACQPLPEKDEFAETEQRLTAECHWQQYQTLSFALPESPAKNKWVECEMNGVRPADDTIDRSNGAVVVSGAVKERFDKGRELRDELYRKLLGETELPEMKNIQFTSDLESLASKTDGGATNEKIALIHLDGNKFGTIRAKKCYKIEDFKEFNNVVQKGIQESALKRLLTFALQPERVGFRTKNNEVRLETLMWGGDEIELIVPASQLWDTLKIFFEVASSSKPFKENPLTYSAGVVVCRHSVPILQIRRYAEQLCGIAKAASDGAPSNQFALLNMASFDAIYKNVGTFLNAYHHPATTKDFIVPFSSMSELRQNIRTIRKNFPKNKLYEIVAELKAEKDIEKIVDRALKMISNPLKESTQKAIHATTASNPNKWFLISDLWSLVDDTTHEPAI